MIKAKQLERCRSKNHDQAIIIGITGKKGHGKNALANSILENLMYNGESFLTLSFMEPLKKALMELYDWDERHVDGYLKEEIDPYWETTPREALQTIGSDLFRTIDKEFWTKRLYLEIEHKLSNGFFNLIVTDVRYLNEASFLKTTYKMCKIVKVVNERIEPDRFSAHISESEVNEISPDVTIYNSGSLNDLYDKFDSYFWNGYVV